MKTKNLFLFAAIAVSFVCPATAQLSYTYDADTGPAGAQDGSGLGWNTTNTNWLLNGAGSDVVWPNSSLDTAVFGAGGTGGTVTVGTVNVGTIQFNSTATTGYTLSTGTITLGTGITTANTLNSTISSVITGTNGLTFNGVVNATNGVTLSGANNYTGITTANNGRLTASNATALGSNAGATASALGTNYTQVNAASTVQINNSTAEAFLLGGNGGISGGNPTGALRIANGQTLSSFVQLSASSTITGNFGTGTISGNVDLGANTLSVGNGSNAITLNISGLVTGTAGGITVNTGSGNSNVLNLTNNANTYAGNTTVQSGTSNGALGLGGDTVLGSSTLVLNGGTVRSTNATARTIANTIGTVGGNGATFGEVATQTGALNFTSTAATSLGTAAKTFTTNVDTTFAAAFSNTANITKLGAAVLTFTGASTRSGITDVNAGTLVVNNASGSGTGSGAVNVTTATLGGNGTIGGIAGATTAVTINNLATLSPGDSAVAGGIGTLTVGSSGINRSVVLGDGSIFSVGVSDATSDLLQIFGGFDLSSGTDTLAISGTLDSVTDYTIATFNPGSLVGTFNTVTGLTAGYTVDYRTDSIVLVAIPEPSSALLSGVALLLALRRRR